MKFDHVALTSSNIQNSIKWYVENWNAHVLYEDETWGLVQVANLKLAFVMSHQHPPHFCFEVDTEFIASKLSDKKFKKHRDGSASCYISDPDGNKIEFLTWNNNE